MTKTEFLQDRIRFFTDEVIRTSEIVAGYGKSQSYNARRARQIVSENRGIVRGLQMALNAVNVLE